MYVNVNGSGFDLVGYFYLFLQLFSGKKKEKTKRKDGIDLWHAFLLIAYCIHFLHISSSFIHYSISFSSIPFISSCHIIIFLYTQLL